MGEITVDIAGLRKSFGKNAVLECVDLRVPRGAIVGLMGMNGSGKSTLIKSLLGLLHTDSGRSRILGCDSANLSPEVKGRLGYVPRNVEWQLGAVVVIGIVLAGVMRERFMTIEIGNRG